MHGCAWCACIDAHVNGARGGLGRQGGEFHAMLLYAHAVPIVCVSSLPPLCKDQMVQKERGVTFRTSNI